MAEPNYEISYYERPGLHLSDLEKASLQQDLIAFARTQLSPLPIYNVFDTSNRACLNDKVIVTARVGPPDSDSDGENKSKGEIIAFVSASLLPISGLGPNPDPDPVLHTGLTIIHPSHQKSQVLKRLLFGTLFMRIFDKFPTGIWLVSLAEVITSLVQISRYTSECFPSPDWPAGKPPGETHLKIGREISEKYRYLFLINPAAEFDETKFVFRGSNDTPEGKVFMKDVDDKRYWHRDEKATQFFRGFFRKNRGDEVLQVGWLEPMRVLRVGQKDGFKNEDGVVSKL
ncbi:membrane protein [Podospora australis]|uniref:Membrane protein n=1 Tax=Podospora australis TaxID=1536484 RepID=A0AAN7AI98_9PEZI|nr:membrane protein [Podospora australis]